MRKERAKVLKLREVSRDGRRIDDVTWEVHQKFPIFADEETPYPIGVLSNLFREGSGWVVGTLNVLDDVSLKGMALQAHVDEVESEMQGDVQVVKTARFRMANLGTQPVWEGMWLDGDE